MTFNARLICGHRPKQCLRVFRVSIMHATNGSIEPVRCSHSGQSVHFPTAAVTTYLLCLMVGLALLFLVAYLDVPQR